MTEPLFAVICAAFVAVLALLAWLGWRSRRRSQNGIPAPATPPADYRAEVEAEVFYVATTKADDEYDRIAVHGLGLRTKSRLLVGEQGILLETPERAVFTPRTDLLSVERATWTIDRAVEPGGLLRYAWRLGDSELATNIRVIGDDETVLHAMQRLTEQEQHID